jgi:tetratricopeptide (TPR) repeat protein
MSQAGPNRSVVLLVVLACTANAPSSFGSIPDAKPSAKFVALSDDALLQQFKSENAKKTPDFCSVLSPVLGEMRRRDSFSGPIQLLAAEADLQCAIDERRWQDAFKIFDAKSMLPEAKGDPLTGIWLAFMAKQDGESASRLAAEAGNATSSVLSTINSDIIYRLLGNLQESDKPLRSVLLEAIFASAQFGELNSNVQSFIAEQLLLQDAVSGKMNRVESLLSKIDRPDTFIDLLGSRKYQNMWPVIENAAGPNLSSVSQAYIEKTKNQFTQYPDDAERLQKYGHALLYAGRFEQVIETVNIKIDPQLSEDQAWALNVKAYALDSMGAHEQAEKIFDSIARIPYKGEDDYWLVSFTINRALRLSEYGHHKKALQAVQLAEKMPGSDFANMLVRYAKVCSLIGLGRNAEAKPILEIMYAKRKDAYSTAATALLCAGDDDRAASVVIEALSEAQFSDDIASELQGRDFELFYSRFALPNLRERLMKREDVRAAFEKVARDIPIAFIPEASLKRNELKP